MSQRMPVAERVIDLLASGAHFSYRDLNGGSERAPQTESDRITKRLAKSCAESVRINAQVASDLYWLGSQNFYELGTDARTLCAPYDNCWLEWSIPNVVSVDGKLTTTTPIDLAAFVSTERDGRHRRVVIQMLFKGKATEAAVGIFPVSASFSVDENGLYCGDYQLSTDAGSGLSASETREASSIFWPAFLALELMNCRNVTIEDAGRLNVRRRSSKAKRRRAPHYRFSTIVLPGMNSRNTTPADRKTNSEAVALHRVRGHFKTFTDDRPLFGKHTGTYWWGWQVRGSQDSGVVVSDYKIAT